MWNNLLNYWKEFSLFGALSLPLAGLFFLGSQSSINWKTPLGYYTKLRLFINRKNGVGKASSTTNSGTPSQKYQLIKVSAEAKVSEDITNVDLLAEYPLTTLDKESYWRYCLPENSKLNKSQQLKTTATKRDFEEKCEMKWKSSADDVINYLLKIGMDFFKIQHQINLFLIYHLGEKIVDDKNDQVREQILKKCDFKHSSKEHYLKNFFISTTPISKNCLLTPREIELTLETNGASQQIQSSTESQTDLKIDELKRGSVRGSIKYSLSNYHDAELHKFYWKNGHGSDKTDQVLIELKGKEFTFELEESATNGSGKLKLKDLLDKYQKREMRICDFWKDYDSKTLGGGASNNCANQTH